MSYATCKVFQNMGRLGNQLFQAAATIGYARDNDKQYVFPRWSYSNYFELPIKEVDGKLIAEAWLRYTQFNYVDGDVNIHGHLLSEKYFAKHREHILNTFKLNDTHVDYIKDKYSDILSGNSCAIHVRRGDYLLPEQIVGQGIMPVSYYDKAKELVRADKYIVFSDDIEWCKENIVADHYIEGEKDIIDMFMISMCKNVIISNSTFSWWGAWLNQMGGIVVAPRQWFVNTEGWDDLYRDEWIKI